MSPLGKRIVVFFMLWVFVVMIALQLYNNVTGKGIPMKEASPIATAEPSVVPNQQIQQLANLQGCIASDPSNLQCTLDLAGLYYQRGDYAEAQLTYEKANQLSANNYEILLKLAGSYIFQQKFPQAASTLQQASILRPDSPEIHLLLGLSLSKLDPPRMNDAIAEWRKVISLQPDSSLADQARQYINNAGTQ
jgi:cytochrome c-type biogenesis protein CcmH/NrfG